MELSTDVQCVARAVRRVVWLGSLMVGVAGIAEGQESSRLRVAVHDRSASSSMPRDIASMHSAVVNDSARGHPILRATGIGIAGGATAGLVYAFILNATGKCSPSPTRPCISNDEAGLAYIAFPIYGGFFGGIIGAVVGASTR